MKKAHILIQPSVTAVNGDTEGGAPTVILEAQALGIPVISTLHADIPNIVAEPIKKFLVPERDLSSLTDAIANLLTKPQTWPEISLAGRKFVEKFHNINKLTPQLETQFEKLINAWKN